jgi:biopolymer transport protein ExbD
MVLTVSIAADGTYAVDGSRADLEAVGRAIAEGARRGRTADGFTRLVVVVECHPMVPYKVAQVVMVKCLDSKVHQVIFAVAQPLGPRAER